MAGYKIVHLGEEEQHQKICANSSLLEREIWRKTYPLNT